MSSARLKFLVDVGVGTAVEEYLREQEYDTKTIRSIDPRMDDLDIIRLAHAEDRMVLTMDKDFGELVYHSAMSHSGILLLRLDDATGEEKKRVPDALRRPPKAQDVPSLASAQRDAERPRLDSRGRLATQSVGTRARGSLS